MVIMIAAGLAAIYIKQKGGLHNKRRDRGIFIYKSVYKNGK